MEGEGARDVNTLSRVPTISLTDASGFRALSFLLLEEIHVAMSHSLYFAVAMTTSGDAQVIVQQVETNNGYEAYRSLCTTCDPTTSMRGLSILEDWRLKIGGCISKIGS